MINLWERLTHIYGGQFTGQFGKSAVDEKGELTDVAKTWSTGLGGISGEQLANGLRRCCDDHANVWPSLPMFKSKCMGRDLNDMGLDYVPEYYRPKEPVIDKAKTLSSADRDSRRDQSRAALAEMKSKLSGNGNA